MTRVLISEDDQISRRMLEATLRRAGYDIVVTADGAEALAALTAPDAPRLAVLDWMMPMIDGVEVVRRIRARQELGYVYVILLTARAQKGDLIAAFDAGTDDYLTKPFDPHELRARLSVGERLLELQQALTTKVTELESALGHVKQLQGLLPICMHCKKIRADDATWHRLETYIEEHSEVNFTHSLCSDCLAEHYPRFEHAVSAKEKTRR